MNENNIINKEDIRTKTAYNEYLLYKAHARANELAKQIVARGFDSMLLCPDWDKINWFMNTSVKKITRCHLGWKLYMKITKAERKLFFDYFENMQIEIENGLLDGKWNPRKYHYC